MIFTRKQGSLEPLDHEAHKIMLETSNGDTVAFDKVIKPRNVKFLRKYFVLLNHAYESWIPGELTGKLFDGVQPEKSFEQFREDVIILSGYYKQSIRLNGDTVIKAKSISFATMKEEAFEELYNNTINVILKHVLTNYDRENLDKVILEIIGFG